jgi:TetR/AcrR family transcriptional repressor of nem operon
MAVPCPRTRGDERTRAAATQAFLKLVGVIAAQFGKTRPDVARRRALVAAATMIGALTMSRIVTDSELSAAILRQTERHLIRTAGATDGLSKSASEA